MRTKILAALITTSLALAACGGEAPPPQPPPAPPPPTTAETTAPPATTAPPPPAKPALSEVIPQTLKGQGDAFNAHDAQKMASYFTDDATSVAYGEGETHSKGDIQSYYQDLFTGFSDIKSAPTRIWIKDNVAIAELHSYAVARSGLRFDNRYCWVVEFSGQTIVRVRAYLDSALVARLFAENPLSKAA